VEPRNPERDARQAAAMREALKKIDEEDAAREARDRERARQALAPGKALTKIEVREVTVPEPLNPEQPQTYIGDIGVSERWIWTPIGVFPIRGSRWAVQDSTAVTQQTSGAGIALAIVFFAVSCGLSLFFLLMKTVNVSGVIQVTVEGDGFQYTTMLTPRDAQTGWQVTQQVNWARGIAAMP